MNWPKRSSECPKQLPNSNSTERDQLSLLCFRFPQVIEALNAISGHTGANLYEMERDIRDASPKALDLSDDYRKRRGLWSWIGGVLSSVFGLVSEDQIKQMKDSVQSMLEASRHDMQKIKTFSCHVSTYMKANNLRLDGLVESLKAVQKDAFDYAHSIGDSVTHQIQMLASLTGFITKDTENMKSL